MTHRALPRRTRIRWFRVAVLIAVVAAIAVAQWPASAPSTVVIPTVDVPRRADVEKPRRLGGRDGAMPAGATVFDDEIPGVAKLDADLLAALRRAATDAAAVGVEFVVDSGWRSRDYQEHLLREAVAKYGSEAEAARWVATPDTSAHVSGDAVDLGGAAAEWLASHGAAYGLCQVYGNEPWHYELRPVGACPPVYPDPTYDPRLQA